MTQAGRADAWSASAVLVGGWLSFPSRVADNQPIEDPAKPRVDVGLTTLVAGFGRGAGFGAEVQLPFGVVAREDIVTGVTRDVGLGDLELRARYGAPLGRARLTASAGFVFPTGRYTPRSGQAALTEGAQYLTLGRGVTWGVLDAEARYGVTAWLAPYLSSTARLAFHDSADGFRWGPEVRGAAGVAVGPFAGRVSGALAAEVQWRAQSSEVDPFTNSRIASVNTGGTWLTLTATGQVRLAGPVSALLSVRVPLAQRLEGLQFVPGPGVFVGLSGSWEVIAPKREAAAVQQGQVTLVDYWATWCAPCVKLAPQVEAAEKKYPRLTVRRVDVSQWSDEELEKAVPGAKGLPIVEVYRADGALAARLEGEQVFTFEKVLEEVMR